jgi:hypothetical protein
MTSDSPNKDLDHVPEITPNEKRQRKNKSTQRNQDRRLHTKVGFFNSSNMKSTAQTTKFGNFSQLLNKLDDTKSKLFEEQTDE